MCEKQYSYTLDEELSSLTPIDTIVYEYGNSSWTDQLTSYYGSEIEYDAMGNPLIYWDGSILSWENGTRLKSIESPLGMVTYTYNDEGIRTSKTVNNSTHTYVLEGTRIISETYGNVVVVYLYDESNSPIGLAYKQGNDNFEQYFFTKNLQGDILKIYSEGGELAVEYKYDAWGAIVDISYSSAYEKIAKANSLLYRGYYYDFETGYYYLNSRYYDPQAKRFISPDFKISNIGGSIQGYNLYVYCFNNPIMYLDSSGNWPEWLEEKIDQLAIAFWVFTVEIIIDTVNYDEDNKNVEKVYESNHFSSYNGTLVIRHSSENLSSWSIFGMIFLESDTENWSPDYKENCLKHEYGHTLQEGNLGTGKYFSKVAIPSITINLLESQGKLPYDYYSYPWEAEANRLGGSNLSQNKKTLLPENGYTSYWSLIPLFFK